MKVLIVEDEPKTASYLKKGLSESGFVVDVASDGEQGLHQALDNAYEVIISDVMLPRMDGWTMLSRLRERGVTTPVLLLTARDAVPDRVRGLELGADDYLVKLLPSSFHLRSAFCIHRVNAEPDRSTPRRRR